jgi:deoxyuridine 5'-triphosphate nucleotidohydrolase
MSSKESIIDPEAFQPPRLRIKKVHPDARTPSLGSEDAAGLDLCTVDSVDIPAGKRALLKTGLSMAIPPGLVGLIWPRSKLAAKHGLDVLAGVVDADYRGEVMISLLNTGDKTVELRKGDKVAQMILQPYLSWIPLDLVDTLPGTERGGDGINSNEMRLRSH